MDAGAPREVIVVGGGLAGLAAAWRLRDRDVVVLEGAERAGGRIRSEPRDPYWLNLAAHLFPGPESPLGALVEELGLETVPVPGSTMGVALNGKVVSTGRVETYPFRLPMPAAARLSLVRAGLKLRGAVSEYRALARPHPGDTLADIRARLLGYRDKESFTDFLGPVHPDVDAILRPAIRRVSAEPEDLAAGAGAAQFTLTFSGAASLAHRNLRGGSSLLPQALARGLGERLLTGAAVSEVAAADGLVRVRFRRGGADEELVARAAIVATPAPVAARIVRGLPPETEAALREIRYGPYVVGAFLTRETGPMPYDSIYAIAVARKSFNMFFNQASILREGPRRPGGSLMVYGSAELGRRLLERSDEEVRDTFLRDIESLFPETRGIVEEVLIQRWEAGLCFSHPGRHLLQPALDRPLGSIVLAGDYLGERGGMDVTCASGLEAAAKVEEALGRPS